ncbi:hypothetical protein F7725_006813 [Dissostichus mawsoni]|uniref:G-protein coupled receptors family 1 profile domain-containing protein n=1 Tax=Dissostichus mawsoni TaxID=36200 RepID=A0A7J5XVL9_DISMA|nr:hypothetical protein F7725_006813 [Dissostichus mawsoni]
MDFFNSALGKNITFVRPEYFIISGFIGIPNINYYYVFLFFVYIVSVLGNTAVMAIIYLDHRLRTPKYIVVFNLAFVDLYVHPYADCLAFLFFCYTCLSMQVLNLVALSYDRLIAIIYPLHYQVKVHAVFDCLFWVFVITVVLIAVGLLTRLSFCKSVVINSYFCDHGQIYRMACNDINLTASLVYSCIGYALSKVATVHERVKAFKTCTAHLSLVVIYFVPILVTFTMTSKISPNARILNLSLTSVFPPMLNPIIYCFIGIPNINYYYVFLFFVYIVSVLGNTAVMAIIYLDHRLRTPKYIVVFNLAFVDLCGSSALVPKVLDIFLFNHQYIPYADCLAFLFFCYTCLSMQVLNLVALSYDRLIAIIYPLHYQVKVHAVFDCLFWVFVITVVLIAVGLLTRLSFCKSVVINSYFCDHGQIYRLACNDYKPTDYFILILWLPLTFILFSYSCIGYALSKVATVHERVKAFKTCTAHLSLVVIYFVPILVTFTMTSKISPNARILNLSLTSVFPPMLNPIIYVLQTQEIKESMKRILKFRKKSKITREELTSVQQNTVLTHSTVLCIKDLLPTA